MRLSVASLRQGAQEIGRPRLFYLGTVAGGHVVVHWYTGLLSLVLPSLKADLGLTDVQVGTITTAQMGVASATSLPSGYLADSYRRRVALILASAIVAFGLAYFLMGVRPSYPMVLVAAGLVGLGTALWHPAALGSLSLRFPERRGMALSVHGVGASIGDASGPVIVGAIILLTGWRPALAFHLFPALAIAFLLWRSIGKMSVEQGMKPSFRSYVTGLRGMITNRQVLGVMSANTLMSMGRLSILTFLPIYIRETLDFSSFVLGIYLTLLYLMGMVSQPIMGTISDKFGRKSIILPSFVAMGLLYIALVFAPGGILLGLVIGALGLFFYAIVNVTSAAVMDVVSTGVQASTMGVTGLFAQPFTLASPILAGYLVQSYGIKAAFWYAAAVALLGALVILPIGFRRAPASQPGS